MSHPSLGLPPPDLSAGYPEAAARLRASQAPLGARAIEIALERDASLRQRHDELALRHLLRDTETFIDRIAVCVAENDSLPARDFADQVAPLYRRRRVPMDDLVLVWEGLRAAMAATLGDAEAGPMHAAVDAGVAQFRWYRRIAGDARKRNRLLQLLYKGA